jgi:uncharacterized protein
MTADASDFLGTGWAFHDKLGVRFGPRGQAVQMASGLDDIEQSLYILLGTEPGERVMQPTYGCGLRALVFEHLDATRATELEDLVRRAVLHFEPRVELLAVHILTEELAEHGKLRLRLEYDVRGTNTRHNLVYPLYLAEASGTGFAA